MALFKALNISTSKVGKFIKSTKKRIEWNFELDGQKHEIVMFLSRLSNKIKILLDGDIEVDTKRFPEVVGKYPIRIQSRTVYVYQIGDHHYDIRVGRVSFHNLLKQKVSMMGMEISADSQAQQIERPSTKYKCGVENKSGYTDLLDLGHESGSQVSDARKSDQNIRDSMCPADQLEQTDSVQNRSGAPIPKPARFESFTNSRQPSDFGQSTSNPSQSFIGFAQQPALNRAMSFKAGQTPAMQFNTGQPIAWNHNQISGQPRVFNRPEVKFFNTGQPIALNTEQNPVFNSSDVQYTSQIRRNDIGQSAGWSQPQSIPEQRVAPPLDKFQTRRASTNPFDWY